MLGRIDRALWVGPVAFFIAACAWSVLDAEFSTDTWMGLAAGRQIVERLEWGRFHETFPMQDTFSYTFFNQTWFNHNWLSNLGQYWIYDRWGPSAVVYVTWAIAGCIQLFVLLAVYWRTESWLAGWLAAAMVGIGGRDFLEPRAAIVGLFCLAALWALICAVEGQRDRPRWWPIVPVFPLVVFWSCAHGGFVFGYGLLALYCGHWLAARAWRSICASLGAGVRFAMAEIAASGTQILAVAVALVAAITVATTLDPFGIESLLHPGKIASSGIFRSVSEWHPAYVHVSDSFPPMRRFWAIAGLVGIGFLVLWSARKIATRSNPRGASDRPAVPWSAFDVTVVVLGLSMTIWARRFAPLAYVLSAPVLAVWFMRLSGPLAPRLRGYATTALKLTAGLAAVVTGWLTWSTAQRELVDAFKDQPDVVLIERARGYRPLAEAIRFIAENRLRVNLLTDYGAGGSVSFYAPLARVFIDGRSDQLYTEQHLTKYYALMNSRTPAHELQQILDESGTDAVLVPWVAGTRALQGMLQSSTDWVLVFLNSDYRLFLRSDSAALKRLGDLLRVGREWRPAGAGAALPYTQVSRAMVLLTTAPADPAQALDLLKTAVERRPQLGRTFYPILLRVLVETAGTEAAADYVRREVARVTSNRTLPADARAALLATLAEFAALRYNFKDLLPRTRESPCPGSDSGRQEADFACAAGSSSGTGK